MSTVRPRTVSGMRPTGPLHLGHYFGVLKNWVELQHSEEAYFFVADWHALTSDYADPSNIATNVEEMVKDWVAAGLDPEKCVIFRQSAVKEHAELSLLLSMITPVSWLERNPTYKEQQQQITNKDLGNAGFLCYPVLMAADILMYRPHGVPVGEDQLPHIGADPRDRPPLQLPLRRQLLPRASGHAHPRGQVPRPGRPQDVQELQQRHLPA